MLLFAPFLGVAFAGEMLRQGINIFWWGPPLALISILVLAAPFRVPREIVFSDLSRTMELRYRLRRSSRVHPFDDLDSIRSFIETTGDNDTYIRLEICMKTGERIAIKTELPSWDNSDFLGLKGCQEPESLANLRRKIASLTGISDLGFRQPVHGLRQRVAQPNIPPDL